MNEYYIAFKYKRNTLSIYIVFDIRSMYFLKKKNTITNSVANLYTPLYILTYIFSMCFFKAHILTLLSNVHDPL